MVGKGWESETRQDTVKCPMTVLCVNTFQFNVSYLKDLDVVRKKSLRTGESTRLTTALACLALYWAVLGPAPAAVPRTPAA